MSGSNNNNVNLYIRVDSSAMAEEMESLLNNTQITNRADSTAIDIDPDAVPGTSQAQRHQLPHGRRESGSATRINMENGVGSTGEGPLQERRSIRNILSVIREARHQLHRQQSARDTRPELPAREAGLIASDEPNSQEPSSQNRTWRENLYDVFASPAAPRPEVLRAIFTPSLQDHALQRNRSTDGVGMEARSGSALRLSRQSSRLDSRSLPDNTSSAPTSPVGNGSDRGGTPSHRMHANGNGSAVSVNGQMPPAPPPRQTSTAGSTAPTIDMDDPDENDMSEMVLRLVSHSMRYLPFVCILLFKFVYDHLLGILELIILPAAVYHINKMLKEQVAKLHQKSFSVLMRHFLFATFIVVYRIVLTPTPPDPFGLIINPPGTQPDSSSGLNTVSGDTFDSVRSHLSRIFSSSKPSDVADKVPSFNHTAHPISEHTLNTKSVPLGVLLYYIAMNDLVLKLLTQLIKILITMFPMNVIHHKSRARLYAVIEYISQFYRALAPIKQWHIYLFESYSGLETISGILFSLCYFVAKSFELVERGKSLKKALENFVRNMDYDRKPTKDELDAAGTVCPICHDSYTTPVVLECGHIFCDQCVNTWFKREQTCPMCRAKVSEDPTWQDGATSLFFQLF